jgi:hypothetical protein
MTAAKKIVVLVEQDPFPPFREPTVLDATLRQACENSKLAAKVERIVRTLPPPAKRK